MATELNKPLIRDTGLKAGDTPVFVTLIPTKDGGALVLKEKGKRGKGTTIPLKTLVETPEKTPDIKRTPVNDIDDPRTADLVDLSQLEARIMIDGEGLTADAKGRLWSIVREMREERREEFGLKPVYRGVTKKAKTDEQD